MGQLTPSFLIDLETRMRVVAENEYARLNARPWASKVMTRRSVLGRKERLVWMLSTAGIDYVGRRGAQERFQDLVTRTVEYEVVPATAAFKVNRFELDDLDGGGVNAAVKWAGDITQASIYWPQKQLAKAIRDNTIVGYDGLTFFNASHDLNPFDSAAGTYSNDLTGGASGSFPGAVPIDTTNAATLDIAFTNLAKAIQYVDSFKMPNGEDPRNLEVVGVMGPPALRMRLQQLTNAKFIATGASSGGGSADVEAVVRDWALGEPIIANELGAGYTNGSDTTYYLIVGDTASAQDLSAFAYLENEPFSIIMNGAVTDAQLARANEVQWLTRGRNVIVAGHPYRLLRCKAT